MISQINGLYSRVEQQMGLNLYETRVLYTLYVDELNTQKCILDNYSMPKQTVNNIITSLHVKGYIEIRGNEKDHRRKDIELITDGKDYAAKVLSPILRLENNVINRLGKEKCAAFCSLLEDYERVFEQATKEYNRKDVKK